MLTWGPPRWCCLWCMRFLACSWGSAFKFGKKSNAYKMDEWACEAGTVLVVVRAVLNQHS